MPPNAPSTGSDATAAPTPESSTCVGCGRPVTTRFCPDCGQDERRARLTWNEIWGQCRRLSSIDGPLWSTLTGLLLRPGPMIRDYLDAHRRRYAGPLGFALAVGGFAILAQAALLRLPEAPPDATPRVQAAVAAGRLILNYSHLITLALVPVLALVLTLIGRRYGRTSAEHTVFGLYAFAGAFLLQALLLPLVPLWPQSPTLGLAIAVVAVVYVLWAGVGYLGGPVWPALWRVFVADAALYAAGTALQIAFVRVYVWFAT